MKSLKVRWCCQISLSRGKGINNETYKIQIIQLEYPEGVKGRPAEKEAGVKQMQTHVLIFASKWSNQCGGRDIKIAKFGRRSSWMSFFRCIKYKRSTFDRVIRQLFSLHHPPFFNFFIALSFCISMSECQSVDMILENPSHHCVFATSN